MRMNDIKDRLFEEFNLLDWNNCIRCSVQPKLIIRDEMAMVRCNQCGKVARGFVSAPCLKVDKDIKSSIYRLKTTWNEVNPK